MMKSMKTSRKSAAKLSITAKVTVTLILFCLVILPLIQMFASLEAKDFKDVTSSPLFGEAVKNSAVLSGIATLISVGLALLLAFCVVRNHVPFGKTWNVILTLPMLIPSISHGMGLIILFGGNGIIKNLLGLEQSIYGPVGIIAGSVMYAFPVAYIMLSDVLKYQDMSVYDAADILGIGKARQFFRLTLPYLKKPLIAAIFSSFALIVTDYGVPLMIGGKTKTISLLMFEEVTGQLNFGRGCVYGLLLLIPALVAFVTDLLNKDRGNTSFVTYRREGKHSKAKTFCSMTVLSVVSLLALLPLLAFAILAFAKSYPSDMSFTFGNIINTFKRGGEKYLINSLVIALAAALTGTVLSYLTAYLTSRMTSGLSRIIHLLVLTFMVVPGMVLGLSYVITFSDSPIYGTLFIMIMVNVAHFMSSPYLMMHNSFRKMNGNLEAVGATLGVGRLRLLKDVFLPQNAGTLTEMFSYLFVNCMMTISAVSFLADINTKPLSLMINQFEAQRQYECVAVVSLLILIVNIVQKSLLALVKSHFEKRKRINA